MRTVVELMETTVRLLTAANGPVLGTRSCIIPKGHKLIIPCTSSITGLLSMMVKPGEKLTAKQVMFTALSVKDTVSLSVDMRIFSVPFTVMVDVMTPIPSSICCSLTCQVKLLPTAVQVNSATPLMETLTARGGMVIPALNSQYNISDVERRRLC